MTESPRFGNVVRKLLLLIRNSSILDLQCFNFDRNLVENFGDGTLFLPFLHTEESKECSWQLTLTAYRFFFAFYTKYIKSKSYCIQNGSLRKTFTQKIHSLHSQSIVFVSTPSIREYLEFILLKQGRCSKKSGRLLWRFLLIKWQRMVCLQVNDHSPCAIMYSAKRTINQGPTGDLCYAIRIMVWRRTGAHCATPTVTRQTSGAALKQNLRGG